MIFATRTPPELGLEVMADTKGSTFGNKIVIPENADFNRYSLTISAKVTQGDIPPDDGEFQIGFRGYAKDTTTLIDAQPLTGLIPARSMNNVLRLLVTRDPPAATHFTFGGHAYFPAENLLQTPFYAPVLQFYVFVSRPFDVPFQIRVFAALGSSVPVVSEELE